MNCGVARRGDMYSSPSFRHDVASDVIQHATKGSRSPETIDVASLPSQHQHDRTQSVLCAAFFIAGLLDLFEAVKVRTRCRHTPSSPQNRQRRHRCSIAHRAIGRSDTGAVIYLEPFVTQNNGTTISVSPAERFNIASARGDSVASDRTTSMSTKRNNDAERAARVDRLVEEYRTNPKKEPDHVRVRHAKASLRRHEPRNKKRTS
jgi:hypothetical protein